MIEARHHGVLDLISLAAARAGWRGQPDRVAAAIPHDATALNFDEIAHTLRNMGLPVTEIRGRVDDIAPADTPCLFASSEGGIQVILDVRDGEILACGEQETPVWKPASSVAGRLVHVGRVEAGAIAATARRLPEIVRPFRGEIGLLAAASFFISLLSYLTPLLIMVIYDRVIPAQSTALIVSLAVAAAGVLAVDFALRVIRSRSLAWIGQRIERQMGLSLFRKLATMPLERLQKSDVDQQIARLKQFESLRDIFTGPILNTLLDLPFTILFLIVLWLFAPMVGGLIFGLIVVLGVMTAISLPIQLRLNARAAQDRARHQALVLEAAGHQRDLQRLDAGEVWQERHAALASVAAASTRKARQCALIVQSCGQSVMMFSGVGAIALGTSAALAGDMTFGALIAVMALVWKVLAPFQALQANATQIVTYLRSARQVERVLSVPEEYARGAIQSHTKRFRGRLVLAGVSHRYEEHADPSLSNVSLVVESGELVVVAGRNASGKSTLLKLLDGLVVPRGGTIQIDGIDYRQIAVDDLRAAIAYAPQDARLFYGTVAQNIRLAAPLATDAQLWQALDALGVRAAIEALPDGIDTRLTEGLRRRMSRITRQGIALARVLVSENAGILLFDTPCDGLDEAHEAAFLAYVQAQRGRRTVIMVSDRPSHMRLADRLIFLDRGRVVINDTGESAQRKMSALLNAMREV